MSQCKVLICFLREVIRMFVLSKKLTVKEKNRVRYAERRIDYKFGFVLPTIIGVAKWDIEEMTGKLIELETPYGEFFNLPVGARAKVAFTMNYLFDNKNIIVWDGSLRTLYHEYAHLLDFHFNLVEKIPMSRESPNSDGSVSVMPVSKEEILAEAFVAFMRDDNSNNIWKFVNHNVFGQVIRNMRE